MAGPHATSCLSDMLVRKGMEWKEGGMGMGGNGGWGGGKGMEGGGREWNRGWGNGMEGGRVSVMRGK